MKPYRILMICDRYLPEPVLGYERFVQCLSRRLIDRGHRVTVLTQKHAKDHPTREQIDGVDIWRYTPTMVPEKLWMFRRAISYRAVRPFLRDCEGQYDILISHYPYIHYARRFAPSIRRIYRAGGTLLGAQPWENASLKARSWKMKLCQGINWRYMVKAEQKTIQMSHHIVVPSANVKDQLVTYYHASPDRISIVPHGVESDVFCPDHRTRGETLHLVSVGRLHAVKNHRLLLEAMAVARHGRSIRARLVGEGEERSRLEQTIRRLGLEDRVELVGHCSQVQSHYQWADVFVLPSLYEAFGIVLLEAMSCGLPCVALRSSPPRRWIANDEIIEDGATGVLVNDEHPETLAQTLDELYENPERCRQMGRAGRQRVMDTFQWTQAADRYQMLIEKMMNGKSHG